MEKEVLPCCAVPESEPLVELNDIENAQTRPSCLEQTVSPVFDIVNTENTKNLAECNDTLSVVEENAEADIVDKLVNMTAAIGTEEDEDDCEYLSASDGESDDEKIQQWGDAPTVADTKNPVFDSPFFDNKCSPKTPENSERDISQECVKESNEHAESEEDNRDGGDDENSVSEAESKSNLEKEEEAAEQKRQELEDSLTEEERQTQLAEAVKLKGSGNEAFRLGQYSEAVECYSQSLELCPLRYVQQRSVMLSNRAACRMKEENYEAVVKDCTKAVDLQPTYIKAINRRADAYERLEKLEEALKDHQKILELDRSQAASYYACMRLEQEIKERNEKLKQEMLSKLKDLGNMVLRPFGLSTNNFQLQQDPTSGSYSVQFMQTPSNGR